MTDTEHNGLYEKRRRKRDRWGTGT